jgi:hypothetical protein
LFLWGTANPKGVRQLTDKAEARRTSSAQAAFPSRRARENTVSEKDNSRGKTQADNRKKPPVSNKKLADLQIIGKDTLTTAFAW